MTSLTTTDSPSNAELEIGPDALTACQTDAARFFSYLYGRCPSDSMVVIGSLTGRGMASRTFPLDESNVYERIAAQYAGIERSPAVYARVTVLRQQTQLRPGQRGMRTDTYGSAVLWTEVDPTGDEDFRERKLEEIREFHVPPSLIVFSGRGYHLYWFLEEFTDDWQWVEQANKWLGMQLEGDHVFDAARVMRVPGTWNDKEDARCFARIVEEHPDRVYARDRFATKELETEEQEALAEPYEAEDLPLDFEDQIKATSYKLWARIFSEETALEAGAAAKHVGDRIAVDRSRNDFAIALHLLRLKRSHGQVFAVLSHPTWFSGAKFREGYNEYYVRRTVAQAADYVDEKELNKAPLIARKLEDRYVILYHQLTWWVYSPERGVFVPGRTELALAIQGLSGIKWTKTLQDNVFYYLKERRGRDELLAVPDLINVTNGMLSWKPQSGVRDLKPHSPGYESVYQVRATWDTGVDCSEVDAAVSRVFAPEAARIWWMFCGFCLFTGDNKSIRCLLAIVGPKRRGKTTMLMCLREFLGRENVSEVSLAELTGEGNQFTTSRMIGKLLNMDVDAPYEVPAKKLALLKKLAERMSISVERKFEDAGEVDLNVKLAFAMNDFPRFGIADDAVYDRWVVLQPRTDLPAMYPGKNGGVANLHTKLLASDTNRSAWLLRSIKGLHDLMQEGGFPDTEIVVHGRNQMRYESDSVYRYWVDCTEEAPGQRVLLSLVYEKYCAYCAETGVKGLVGRNTFIRDSRQLGQDGVVPGLDVRTKKDPGFTQAVAFGRERLGSG